MVKEYLRPAYRAVTPGFSVQGSTEFLAFLKRAFDAREKDIKWNDDKSIGHGEIMIGDSLIEVSEARPQWPARQCSVHLYVPDADAQFARAVAGGAVAVTPPADAAYGDRTANVRDAAGNNWFIATRREGPAVPAGFHSITPYVITRNAGAVMDWAAASFGAVSRAHYPTEDGKVMHAEIQIDDSIVEFSDGSGEWPPSPCNLHLYVPDVDDAYRRALDGGATSVYAPTESAVRRSRMRSAGSRRQPLVRRDVSGKLSRGAASLRSARSARAGCYVSGQLRGTLRT